MSKLFDGCITRGRRYAEAARHANNGEKNIQKYRENSTLAMGELFVALERLHSKIEYLQTELRKNFWERFSTKEWTVVALLVASPHLPEIWTKIIAFLV